MTHMKRQHAGLVVFIAALGMAFGLIGNEIAALQSLHDALAPAFIGKSMVHVGVVIGAFVAGRLAPNGGP